MERTSAAIGVARRRPPGRRASFTVGFALAGAALGVAWGISLANQRHHFFGELPSDQILVLVGGGVGELLGAALGLFVGSLFARSARRLELAPRANFNFSLALGLAVALGGLAVAFFLPDPCVAGNASGCIVWEERVGLHVAVGVATFALVVQLLIYAAYRVTRRNPAPS